MNPDTGHLVADQRQLQQLADAERERYKPVPFHLQAEARRELAGRAETTVNVNGATNLAAWARKQRQKNRVRAKIAKRSRKAGRK